MHAVKSYHKKQRGKSKTILSPQNDSTKRCISTKTNQNSLKSNRIKSNSKQNSLKYISKRNVSFMNAKFQIVQVKVQPNLPELTLLPPPTNFTTKNSNNEYDEDDDMSHSEYGNNSNGFNAPVIGGTQSFLNPTILQNSQQLLDFATKLPKSNTFLVRKKDLEKFYQDTHKLHLESNGNGGNNDNGIKQLLLQGTNPLNTLNNPFNTQLNTPNTMDNIDSNENYNDNDNFGNNNQKNIDNQLELYFQEQQIALQVAPKVKIDDLAAIENAKRREFYDSNNAKPLELFKFPKKHEIQAILAASKGDLYTLQQIIGKSYHDCFVQMQLLPRRFVQKTKSNPQDYTEIVANDIDINFTPQKYHFFQQKEILDDFFNWMNQSFSPQTLQTFRQSSLYTYNISAQLQKGGSVLHHAAQRGDLNTVKFVLAHGGAQYINQQTSNNSTPLHWACGSGWLDVVKVLIEEHGADIHKCTNSWSVDVFGRDSGQLPIHWASASGHSNIVEYLYQLSPLTIGVKDEKDNSVVCVAKKGLHFDTIRKVQSAVQDEYVPVKLEIHTIEHNMYFDHTRLGKTQQQKSQQNENGNVDNNGDDVVDLEHTPV